jgi:PAS domain S-box-containing protein
LSDFRELFESSRVAMSLLSPDRRYFEVNQAMADMLESDRDKLAGRPLNDFIPEGEQADADAAWTELRVSGHRLGRRRVKTVAGGIVHMSYSVVAVDVPEYGAAYLVVTIEAHMEDDDPPPPTPAAALTRREHEMVQLVALGLTGAEIAERLNLSPETVRTHVRHAMAKTGARTRAQLVAIAVSQQLIKAQ